MAINRINNKGFVTDRNDTTNSLTIDSGNIIISNGTLTISGSKIGPIGSSTIAYVTTTGNDSTGIKGNQALPFLTVQAALNACVTDDTVLIGPGTFTATTAVTIPQAVNRIRIKGASSSLATGYPGVTILTSLINVDPFDISANLDSTHNRSGVIFEDLTIASGGGTAVFRCDGSNCARNGFMSSIGPVFINVNLFVGSALFKYCLSGPTFQYCRLGVSTINIINCGASTFFYTECPNSPNTGVFSFDGDDPLSPTVQGIVRFFASRFGGSGALSFITLGGQQRILVDSASTIGGLRGSNLSVATGSALFPGVYCRGTIAGQSPSVDFASAGAELPNTATAMNFDFRGTSWGGDGSGVATATFKVSGAGLPQAIRMEGSNATFGGAPFLAIPIMLNSMSLTAGNGINLVCKGLFIPTMSLITSGTGTINPGQMVYNVALGSATQSCPLGFTSPVSTYVAHPSPDSFSTGFATATGYTTSSFNISTLAGGGNARVIVVWP